MSVQRTDVISPYDRAAKISIAEIHVLERKVNSLRTVNIRGAISPPMCFATCRSAEKSE